MTPFTRPYCSSDRDALLWIGAETAYFGEPIEAYMEDRQIFMDAFYSYYTDYEPEHAWVACEGSKLLGFLTGCVNSGRHAEVLRKKILPLVLGKWFRGQYHPGLKTYRYAASAAMASLSGEFPPVNVTLYPAHLHINLLAEARGKGLGKALINAYLAQLRELHVRGVHLRTTSQNVAACRLYEAVGFHLLSARQTRMVSYLIRSPVENRCYGMQLDQPDLAP